MKNNDKDVTLETDGRHVGVATDAAEPGIAVQIPGLRQYISIARDAVDAFGEQLHLPPDTRAAIKLAVGEACNNAVIHPVSVVANASGSTLPAGVRPIVVAARADGEAMEIDVTNRGNGFHPTMGGAMPDVYAEHGRGIALMEMLMDSVEYLSVNGDTVVRLRKCLRPDVLAPAKP